jgi:hypothetical protein
MSAFLKTEIPKLKSQCKECAAECEIRKKVEEMEC